MICLVQGSGKTLAYVLPAVQHVIKQVEQFSANGGPVVLVVVPTRELALQVYEAFRPFARVHDLSVVCAHGGGSKYEQEKALKSGCEICVATPVSLCYFFFIF